MILTEKDIRQLLAGREVRAAFRFNESMAGHTTLRIGGPADVFVEPSDAESLGHVLKAARTAGIPVLPVGGGSNLLVRDGGIEGVTVSLAALKGMEVLIEDGSKAVMKVEAGLPLARLLEEARKRGFSGMEGLAGIPGQVGGAIAGNAGAFGSEMKDVVLSVSLMDSEGNVRTVHPRQMAFGYRRARVPDGAIILEAQLRFLKDSAEAVSRGMEAFLKAKKAKQPLGQRSAGCVFKNPGDSPAGRLIEEAGLKGVRRGDIEVSSVHANFFINRGEGTAEDFLRLMEEVAGAVRDRFGVKLEPEIKVVGRC